LGLEQVFMTELDLLNILNRLQRVSSSRVHPETGYDFAKLL